MRLRGVQQGRIVDLDRRRRDGVAEADVDLDRDARAGDGGGRAYPHAPLLRLLEDRRGLQCGDVEYHAVIGDRLSTDVNRRPELDPFRQ